MIRVDQTIIDDGKGDCLRACVCTVMGKTVEEVPNFAEYGFFTGLDGWLNERDYRFQRVELTGGQDVKQMYFGYPKDEMDLMIVWGGSPRPRADGGRKQHAVVMAADGYGLKLVHDPHPDRTGLTSIDGFGRIVFVPREVAQ